MKIVALITIRNEFHYIKYLLKYLRNQEIDVVIIDNDSSDIDLVQSECKKLDNIIDIIHQPFEGEFSLKKQLLIKEEIAEDIGADWVIHHDADEIFQTLSPLESLKSMIIRVNNLGYNVINFDEFVFIPESDTVDYCDTNYISSMKYYYYFSPEEQRLMRAYKRNIKVSNIESGGHKLKGENLNIYSCSMILRHYISLSREMLVEKYKNRKFSKEEIDRGWHANRMKIDWDKVKMPQINMLNHLDRNGISKSRPYSKHFWDW